MAIWDDIKNAVSGNDGQKPIMGEPEVPPHRGFVPNPEIQPEGGARKPPPMEPAGGNPPSGQSGQHWYSFLLPHKEEPELIGFADDKHGNTFAIFKDKNGDRQWAMDQNQAEKELRKAIDNGDTKSAQLYQNTKDGFESIRKYEPYLGPPIGSPYDFKRNANNGPDQPPVSAGIPSMPRYPISGPNQIGSDPNMVYIQDINLAKPINQGPPSTGGTLNIQAGNIKGGIDLTASFTNAVHSIVPQAVQDLAMNLANHVTAMVSSNNNNAKPKP